MIKNEVTKVGEVRLMPSKVQMIRVKAYKYMEHTFYCKKESGISVSKNLKVSYTYDRATGEQVLTQPFGWEDVVKYFKGLGFTETDSDKKGGLDKIKELVLKQTSSDDSLYEKEITGKSTAASNLS
jgi:hypothetical protein